MVKLSELRSKQRLLELKTSQLREEEVRYHEELTKLEGLGPFLTAKLKPELDQQREQLTAQDADLKRQTVETDRLIEEIERELRQTAEEEFKRDWDEHTKLLDAVQASALKMDRKMIAMHNAGIHIRSHESRMIEFGEQYVIAPSGIIVCPGAGEFLERRRRGEFKTIGWE